MKYFIMYVLLCCYLLRPCFAQETQLMFTLDEAKTYALEHNKTLKNANSDIQIANMQIKQAVGSGLPQVSATLDYMTNFNYEFVFAMGGSSEPPQINYSLLDAGDIEVLKAIGEMFGSSEGSTIVMEDQANATFQVTQLLFSGQYWIGLQLAKIARKIAEKNLTLTTLDVKENVINNYYLILVTQELIRIVDENYKNVSDILMHTTNMYEAGLAEQTDVDQLSITLSQLHNTKNVMERNLQLSYNMFRMILGLDTSQEIILSENLIFIVEKIVNEKLFENNLNLADNPTYQIVSIQEEISQKNVELQKWSYAPTLAGFYSYKEKILETSFDLSPKNAAGLNLSVPIFSGGTKRAQVSKAKIELDKMNRTKELLEDQLSLQDKQLSFELKNAFENYQTQKENVKVAKRVYSSINNKYKQGIVSSLDLTQANSNYLQAENNYLTSILDLLQSKLKMDKLYNKL